MLSEIKIIRVFEDRQQKVTLSPKNMEDLTGMRDIIGENNLIIQADGKLLIRHYVGYVQLNKTRLLVYPKVAAGLEMDGEFNRSFEILLKMLVFSGFCGVKKIPEEQNISKFQNDILEFYIGMFADELRTQFQRDINRGYNNQLENQSFIKGKVDFNETVKHNSFKRHLHYVRYDEFDEKTLLNQIFKTIIQILIKKTRVKHNKINLKQLQMWLEDVETINIAEDTWKGVNFTRQNKKYETAFNMAKLFYNQASPRIIDGNTTVLSFLIPVNQLFETYLYKLLEKSINSDYLLKYQGPIDYLADLNGKRFLQMKPDITVLKYGKVVQIIDAKYKIITDDDDHLLLSQGDVYQMLAYSIRYQCNNILLIYPKKLNDTQTGLVSSFSIKNYEQTVTINLIKVSLEADPLKVSQELFEFMKLQ
ncbi:McrC family protein [Acetobacterium sp.]|jgi:5-methylcytosine-specific restriction enzyme subunit McrC|uniref:McrC family protein n=1 Tax=Acetobacterium sp. TaxID=1872094 RepID=UPI002718383F|nr:hypothetical protein [Acetobacterium sp.]MDO9492569.1 hypothetical protein [Acetobacterium sp.]